MPANSLATAIGAVAVRPLSPVRLPETGEALRRRDRRRALWDRVSRGVLSPTGATGHPWEFDQLAGRLVELSGRGAAAPLTLAFRKVVEAQQRAEPVAWVTDDKTPFYPPDAVANGVDLHALPVVFAADAIAAARAADRLGRSGAFGLIVLDLRGLGGPSRRSGVDLPLPLQTRLASLAKTHEMVLLFLTEKGDDKPSIGSLVSLRCAVRRERVGEGRFVCRAQAVKDKRQGPGWSLDEPCVGPAGLC